MSDELYDQLDSENPRDRIRAIRRLTAIVDLQAIPELLSIYQREDEPPAVRNAARDGLRVFKAIQVALQNDVDVVVPDPDTVKEPRFTPEFLRRLLVVLSVVLAVIVLVDIVLIVLPSGGQTGVDPITAADPVVMLTGLQDRLAQVRVDVDNQRQGWQQYQAIGTLGCDRLDPPSAASMSAADLMSLQVDPVQYPELAEGTSSLVMAVNGVALVGGNWLVGCESGAVPVTAEESLATLDSVTANLDAAQESLEQAALTINVPTEAPTGEVTDATPVEGATSAPAKETPVDAPTTEPPTPTPGVTVDYNRYIAGMRERIDFAMGGRGVATLLTQYWSDVRASGQSFGCRQPMNDANIQDYTSITVEIAALDPVLYDIQNTLNIGLALTRDSLTNFQQGCTAGNFSAYLNTGQQQAQQAVSALNQATAMLDQLQAQISARPQ